MHSMIRILGIDPGLRKTGWGVVETSGNGLRFVSSGTIVTTTSEPLANRLHVLHQGLEEVLGEFNPDEAAVEETFVNKDARSTLKLGQARGIALLTPAKNGIDVSEYAPNTVKKTVVGTGHGDKKQIRMMVRMLLPKATFDTDDAADALAVAICHAHSRKSAALHIAASF